MMRLFVALLAVTSTAVSAQMPTCAFVGDSIALGASQQDKAGCAVLAKTGMNARQWLGTYPADKAVNANKVLISIGSNDRGAAGVVLADIEAMRRAIAGQQVAWIAPGPQFASSRNSVLSVASAFGDVVYERPYDDVARDNVHFTQRGYARIAQLMR